MTFYAMREKFNSISIKLGMLFSKIPLTPNQWTVFALIPAFIAFYFLTKQDFLIAALFFAFSALIDWIDGSVARVTGRTSLFGAYLDTIIDRYVEGLIVLGLLFASLPEFILPAYFWIIFYFFGSLMSTYVKAAAKEKEFVEKEIKGGIVERAEKLIVLFIGILLAAIQPIYLVYVLALLGILANITAFQRILIARKLGKR